MDNIGLVLVMVIVEAILATTGQFKVFDQSFDEANRKSKVTAPDPLSQANLATG